MSETYTIAQWETHPYTSHDKRSWTVHHRIRLKRYDTTTADIVVERKIPKEGLTGWNEVEAYELREHGVEHLQRKAGVMEE
jgi:SPX domain protein involved in polyphosphate accumulation